MLDVMPVCLERCTEQYSSSHRVHCRLWVQGEAVEDWLQQQLQALGPLQLPRLRKTGHHGQPGVKGGSRDGSILLLEQRRQDLQPCEGF